MSLQIACLRALAKGDLGGEVRFVDGDEPKEYGLENEGHVLCYEFDSNAERTGMASLMRRLTDLGIAYKDLSTHQSSLEDIFVELVHRPRTTA